ncbi:MAG: BofC C-terminal domain-containing protein [Bacillota bacterium]|nr:BofC C-terminal domain-containing protein [Bacillota bacterium]
MKPWSKRVVWILCALLLGAAGFVLTRAHWERSALRFPGALPRGGPRAGKVLPPPPPLATRLWRTQSGTRLIVEVHYQQCGDTEIQERPLRRDEVGLTAQEMLALHRKAELSEFGPTRVVLKEQRSGLCPRHARMRHLGIARGRVAVFEGPPGLGGRLLEETPIEVKTLPAAEVEDLRRGVLVRDEEELWGILQGLSSLQHAGT